MLYALSSFVLSFWAGSRLVEGKVWLLLVGSLALGVGVAILARRALGGPQCVLGWDGVAWAVEDGRHGRRGGQAAVMLDLGPWMLVRFTPCGPEAPSAGAAMWLPFSGRGEGRATWQALRVALYAPPPAVSRATAAPAGPGPG